MTPVVLVDASLAVFVAQVGCLWCAMVHPPTGGGCGIVALLLSTNPIHESGCGVVVASLHPLITAFTQDPHNLQQFSVGLDK